VEVVFPAVYVYWVGSLMTGSFYRMLCVCASYCLNMYSVILMEIAAEVMSEINPICVSVFR
jgi:hypothetical protein